MASNIARTVLGLGRPGRQVSGDWARAPLGRDHSGAMLLIDGNRRSSTVVASTLGGCVPRFPGDTAPGAGPGVLARLRRKEMNLFRVGMGGSKSLRWLRGAKCTLTTLVACPQTSPRSEVRGDGRARVMSPLSKSPVELRWGSTAPLGHRRPEPSSTRSGFCAEPQMVRRGRLCGVVELAITETKCVDSGDSRGVGAARRARRRRPG